MYVIIDVEMHAFTEGLRHVSIPLTRLDVKTLASYFRQLDTPRDLTAEATEMLLGLAFEFGQNDHQPQDCPSVSVGDIIRLPITEGTYHRYAVMPVGFKLVDQNFRPPKQDGGMWAYKQWIETPTL